MATAQASSGSEEDRELAKIEGVRSVLGELRHTIGIEPGGGELSLDELRERGRPGSAGDADELRRRQDAVGPDDAYTFIYTSGTTGPPKGCVLTHRNAASVGAAVQELDFIHEGDVSYLYLPLAHVFALTVQLGSFEAGTAIVFVVRLSACPRQRCRAAGPPVPTPRDRRDGAKHAAGGLGGPRGGRLARGPVRA